MGMRAALLALGVGVLMTVPAGMPAHAAGSQPGVSSDGGTIAVPAFKCQQFLMLLEDDPEAATALVRWIDGWHAAGANDTRFAAADYEKMTDGVTTACYRYPMRSLIKVMGGKYR